MNVKTEKMSDDDILLLNSVKKNQSQVVIFVTVVVIVVEIIVKYYFETDNFNIVSQISKLIFYFVPLMIAISTYKRYYNLQLDLKYKEKIVYICNCHIRNIGENSELTILILEDGLRIDLDGYNQGGYEEFFSTEPHLFELHISKCTKTILFCKRIE